MQKDKKKQRQRYRLYAELKKLGLEIPYRSRTFALGYGDTFPAEQMNIIQKLIDNHGFAIQTFIK